MYDNVIKENIRRFRKAKGYTQANMAELLGISVTYYRSIESGDAVLLKHIIEDIAELFEVKDESILNRFGNYMEGDEKMLQEAAATYLKKRSAEEQKTNMELAQYKMEVALMEARMKELEEHISDLQGTIRILKRARGFDDSDKI